MLSNSVLLQPVIFFISSHCSTQMRYMMIPRKKKTYFFALTIHTYAWLNSTKEPVFQLVRNLCYPNRENSNPDLELYLTSSSLIPLNSTENLNIHGEYISENFANHAIQI